MFWITIEHKAVATIFLNIFQKYYHLPIFGILNMSNTNLKKFNVYLHAKITSISDLFFEILKRIANLLL